jgi:large subunit ribosomal protein L23
MENKQVRYRDILVKPIVSEKSYALQAENNCYVFEVKKEANKIEVRKAVEDLFNVHVEKVNIMNVKGKPKRLGAFQGKRRSWKKAIVKLREGETLPFFEGA